jgi:hypothetical protein
MMMSIILLAIIAIVIAGVVKGSGARKQSQWFSGSSTKWFIAGYALFLLASVLIYQLIPKTDEVLEPEITQEEMNQFYNDFHNAAIKGELDSLEGSIKTAEWVFDYDQPKLHLRTKYSNHISVSVVTERKSTNDGTIEAYYYTGVSTAGNIDISNAVSRVDLELDGSTLELMRPEVVERHFAQFIQEFTITQFSEQKRLNNGHHTHIAPEVLYLKIPEELEIVDYANVLWE